MVPKNKKEKAGKRLLNAWVPPEGAGMPVGCVATTFTFSPVFFEEECLSRFLQMQSDALEDGPVYIIEREEKLADVRCASVLVDACHAKGSRSLRWDMLTAKIPKAILHAKVSLLCWSNWIRVIVASANLTDDGYRRNQEIYGIVDFHEDSKAPLQFLEDITTFLRQVAQYANSGSEDTSPALDRWNGFLDAVVEMSRGWGDPAAARGKKDIRIHAIVTGPDRPDALAQVMEHWPEGAAPINAYVTSPFFDPTGIVNRPSQALWARLRQRGEASVIFNLIADQDSSEDRIVLRAPRELLDAEPDRETATTLLCRLDEQGEEKDAVFRPLHLKSIWFEGHEWDAYLIGSGNFTSSGLGLSQSSNLEANILYLVNRIGNPQAAAALEQSCPEGAVIDRSLDIQWEPLSDKGEDDTDPDSIPLPAAFNSAVFLNQANQHFIRLEFVGRPPEGWKVFRTTKEEMTIFDEKQWQEQQCPSNVLLPWYDDMAPSGFEVAWREGKGRAWWPVNVDRAGSLPPPDELKDLPLDLLINVLTSARPLHHVLRNWILNKRSEGEPAMAAAVVDPHKRVDTSAFLLQKTYRITAALGGLRERLERPAMSIDAMEWRLRGPVGVTAVKNAILKEAQSTDEQVFLLTELALELSRARLNTAPGCMSCEQVNGQIQDVMAELKSETMERIKRSPQSLKDYVRSAFSEVMA
jgi:hypothetical protein